MTITYDEFKALGVRIAPPSCPSLPEIERAGQAIALSLRRALGEARGKAA